MAATMACLSRVPRRVARTVLRGVRRSNAPHLPDRQHENPHNVRAHEETTGPEIWAQTAGKLTHFVSGIGTGGTISGASHYLKKQKPALVVVGADPEGSIYSGDTAKSYKVEGIGEDFLPATVDLKAIDRIERVSDKESFLMARRICREEGLLVCLLYTSDAADE